MPLSQLLRIFFLISGIVLFNSFIIQEDPLEESIKRGEALYKNHCITCHMIDGKGIPGVFPPLAGADFLLKKPEESIKAVINGLSGEVVVNNQTYFGEMQPSKLSDQEVADVLNYARNSWGNKSDAIEIEQVSELRND